MLLNVFMIGGMLWLLWILWDFVTSYEQVMAEIRQLEDDYDVIFK